MSQSIDRQASGQQAGFPGVTRKVLERLSLPGDHRELVVVEVTYPPGGVAPSHRHPVGEWSSSSKVLPNQLMVATLHDSIGQARPCRIEPIFHTPSFAIVTRNVRFAS